MTILWWCYVSGVKYIANLPFQLCDPSPPLRLCITKYKYGISNYLRQRICCKSLSGPEEQLESKGAANDGCPFVSFLSTMDICFGNRCALFSYLTRFSSNMPVVVMGTVISVMPGCLVVLQHAVVSHAATVSWWWYWGILLLCQAVTGRSVSVCWLGEPEWGI